MSTHAVDVEALADRILASPRGPMSVSVIETIALAQYVRLQADQPTRQPDLKAGLAAAIAAVLRAFENDPVDELTLAATIQKLKTQFAKEFPDGEHVAQHA